MGANEQGANAIEDRWLTIPRTLCFVLNGEDVLLMKRAPHKRVFPNKFNGVGGHIERDEDPLSSAKREIYEETGLSVTQIELRAVYNVDAKENTGIILFVFVASCESRAVKANDEGTLFWINVREIDQLDLVEDLPIILPRVLNMKRGDAPLFVHVSYDEHATIRMRFAAVNM